MLPTITYLYHTTQHVDFVMWTEGVFLESWMYSHHNVYEFYVCEMQWISGLHNFITTKLMKNA